MSNRKFCSTSSEANKSVKPHKDIFYEKILKALREMKDGGTSETIARKSGIEYAQCHKRIAELVTSGKVYNTGETIKNSSGRSAMVRKIFVAQPKKFVQSELF